MGLLACPFCRELYEVGEATVCPVCNMELAQLHKLPPSLDALHDEEGVAPTAPEQERLPLTYLGRGKGILALCGLVGLGCFFLPWVQLTMPYTAAKSAFDLAHERIGWLWCCCAAWCVLVPTVMSRRTILQLRGARVAAAFLSAVPAVAIGILLAKPPRGGLVPVRYTWDWPMWVTLAVAVLGVLVSVLWLGGSSDDLTPRKKPPVRSTNARGELLH